MDVNYGSVSGQVVEYGYTGAFTGGGVTLDLELTSHGQAHPNSIMANANFATTGTVLLGVVTDTDQNKVQIDWQAISDGQLWRQDIDTLDAVTVTATEDTTATFTLAWQVVDTGEEGQFTGTLNITEPAADTIPDQFDLGANVTGAEPGATKQRTFVLSGIDSGETVTVTATGSAIASPSTAQAGDTITVELTAGTFEAVVSGGVEIGGVSDSFSVTTRAAVLPTLDVALPDLNLGQGDTVALDFDNYISGASSYSLSGLPANSGLEFSGSVLSGATNADDVAGSPFTLTATAYSADGSIQEPFDVTVVDDLAPAITINALTTLDTTPIASGSAGDASAITLQVEGVDVTHTSSYTPMLSNGTWTQQLNELALGTYTMTATGVDDAGNESVVSATLKVVEQIATSPRGLFQPLFRSLTGSVNQTLFR